MFYFQIISIKREHFQYESYRRRCAWKRSTDIFARQYVLRSQPVRTLRVNHAVDTLSRFWSGLFRAPVFCLFSVGVIRATRLSSRATVVPARSADNRRRCRSYRLESTTFENRVNRSRDRLHTARPRYTCIHICRRGTFIWGGGHHGEVTQPIHTVPNIQNQYCFHLVDNAYNKMSNYH